MPLIQVRDVPDHIYRRLVEAAERERRSVAQQVVALLAVGLKTEVDPKTRRRRILESALREKPARAKKLTAPEGLIREDRRR